MTDSTEASQTGGPEVVIALVETLGNDREPIASGEGINGSTLSLFSACHVISF